MTWTITPENVAGLVVGEGCFYAESAADPKYKSGWRIRPGFCIEMRHDERSVLEAVASHLGCGAIYDLDFGRYKGYENRGWHPHVKYRVTRLGDLQERVVPFFTEFPLFDRKHEAFQLFAELVHLLYMGAHRHEAGLEAGRELAARLRAHNTRGMSGTSIG
ncbi:MAG: LAGLIDADG family homing endonuclease [Actinomycetota bacterium]